MYDTAYDMVVVVSAGENESTSSTQPPQTKVRLACVALTLVPEEMGDRDMLVLV